MLLNARTERNSKRQFSSVFLAQPWKRPLEKDAHSMDTSLQIIWLLLSHRVLGAEDMRLFADLRILQSQARGVCQEAASIFRKRTPFRKFMNFIINLILDERRRKLLARKIIIFRTIA